MSGEYESLRRITIKATGLDCDGATWVPVCPHCGRFVKADESIRFRRGQPHGPNATCKKCGRVQMPFEGFM